MDETILIESIESAEKIERSFNVLSRLPRCISDPCNPFERYNDALFFQHFRFTKESAKVVIEKLIPFLSEKNCYCNSIPPFMRILCTLHYLGTGNCFWNIGNEESVSTTSAWRSIYDGINALCK